MSGCVGVNLWNLKEKVRPTSRFRHDVTGLSILAPAFQPCSALSSRPELATMIELLLIDFQTCLKLIHGQTRIS